MSELGVALTLSQVRPFELDEVIAGWVDSKPGIYGSSYSGAGYVVKLLNGRYAYISYEIDHGKEWTKSSTRFFDSEPTFIYDRARNWNHNKEELNATLPWAKTQAKYPDTDRTSGGEACSRPMVRVQAPQPGA